MIDDLETALEVEAARAGVDHRRGDQRARRGAAAEAQALGTRSVQARDRAGRSIGVALIAAALIIVTAAHRPGRRRATSRQAAGTEVKLPVDAASDYDPAGDGEEIGSEAARGRRQPDRNRLDNRALRHRNLRGEDRKTGVGLYVDAGSAGAGEDDR